MCCSASHPTRTGVVVEDEVLVAFGLVAALRSMDYQALEPALSVSYALERIARQEFVCG
jgi:hypothetical protein